MKICFFFSIVFCVIKLDTLFVPQKGNLIRLSKGAYYLSLKKGILFIPQKCHIIYPSKSTWYLSLKKDTLFVPQKDNL